MPAGTLRTVGAHEFRNLFGWCMERASAGEEILVTRRGKPFVRMSPPQAQLCPPRAVRLPLVEASDLADAGF